VQQDLSSTSLIELLRRLENLLRQGTIQAVDHDGVRVRVQSGDIRTNWLPWFERRAGSVRSWSPPSVGEQCLVLSPGGDLANGMVLVGLNSDSNPAAANSNTLYRTVFPDDAVVDYDFSTHTLVCTLPAGGSGTVNAPDSITINTKEATINAANTTITGACVVQGLLSFTAGMAGSGGGGAVASFEGQVESSGDIVASGISLVEHRHPGVIHGEDLTGSSV